MTPSIETRHHVGFVSHAQGYASRGRGEDKLRGRKQRIIGILRLKEISKKYFGKI
jgi:hypothetical protein